ncbi:hypothetical protein ABIB85_007676 [Bradyrhizobium sp. JR1.5]|uniref:hypothetical protein n=1 Tax=unclassified Bradyrhizobium TaxID=2631580 RepID=UPI003395A324
MFLEPRLWAGSFFFVLNIGLRLFLVDSFGVAQALPKRCPFCETSSSLMLISALKSC